MLIFYLFKLKYSKFNKDRTGQIDIRYNNMNAYSLLLVIIRVKR